MPAETVLSRELRFSTTTPSSGRSQTRDKQSPGPQMLCLCLNNPPLSILGIQGDPASSLARYCFVSRGTAELWGQGLTSLSPGTVWAGISSLVRHRDASIENASHQSPFAHPRAPVSLGPRVPHPVTLETLPVGQWGCFVRVREEARSH